MDLPFTGSCQCGEISYECSEAPLKEYICHCVNCQKTTGSAFHAGLLVERETVSFTKGEPKRWDRLADSGNTVTEAFCGTCGTPIYVASSGRPLHMSLKAGATDKPTQFQADSQIWVSKAVPWHDTCRAEDRHEKGYQMGNTLPPRLK